MQSFSQDGKTGFHGCHLGSYCTGAHIPVSSCLFLRTCLPPLPHLRFDCAFAQRCNLSFIVYSPPTPKVQASGPGWPWGDWPASPSFLHRGKRGVHSLAGAILQFPGVSKAVSSRINQVYCLIQLHSCLGFLGLLLSDSLRYLLHINIYLLTLTLPWRDCWLAEA